MNNHKYEYELTTSYADDLISFYQTYGKKISLLLTKHDESNLLLKLSKATKNVFYKNHITDSTELAKFEIIYSFISSAFIGSFVYWHTSKNPLSINEFLELSFGLSNILLKNDKNIN